MQPTVIRSRASRTAQRFIRPENSRISLINVHGLPYKGGLSEMEHYRPDRFTSFCDERADAKECLKVRDDKTGRVVEGPHWEF
jgi:hypothetical protein